MEDLFFELIQISIGNKQSLNHIPTGDEWQWLYNMSRKQTLNGVCFRGVDYLCWNPTESDIRLVGRFPSSGRHGTGICPDSTYLRVLQVESNRWH